jgi:CHAT domain-containing protein
VAAERALLFPDGEEPPPLPGTRPAAEEIAALYGGRPLLGPAATEAAVRKEIGGADVVHLATHGYLNPYRAMSSGLLLSAPPAETTDSAADGALLAWEIQSQLKLHAELVVLAACESGRGDTARGEGVLGITRALQCAGARAVVASQWKIAEAPTMKLTLALHRAFKEGKPKDEALRQAMLALRRDPATAHPFYWAAFYLLGDPANPLPASTPPRKTPGARPARPRK